MTFEDYSIRHILEEQGDEITDTQRGQVEVPDKLDNGITLDKIGQHITPLIVVRIVTTGRRTVMGKVGRIQTPTDAFAASVQADIAAKVSSNDLLGYRQDIQVNQLKRIYLVRSQLERINHQAG